MTVSVIDDGGQPLSTVMVTQFPGSSSPLDLDDHGYPRHGQLQSVAAEQTRFTNVEGVARFAGEEGEGGRYRFRKPGYRDVVRSFKELQQQPSIQMNVITSELELAEQKTSNLWLSQLDFNGDAEFKKHFQLNCGFCHQQASPFMRIERSPEQWLEIINRMNGYGARLADDDKQPLAEYLTAGYRELRSKATELPDARPWDASLADTRITEWPIGDAFSQMHDFILHPNGLVYVGDNLQDRIYEVDPTTGEYTVYVIPKEEGMQLGGFLGNRFKTFPKLANYWGVHSFAISPTDGHIFITPSMQRALLEFDPVTKEFTTHELEEGFYPHTIRADEQDRIWFTLAVSSQVGMLDRKTGKVRFYDLPARSAKEWLVFKALPVIFSFDSANRPEPSKDRESTGLPMPYGIDVAPNGTVWAARLYGNDLARIDPNDHSVTMIELPFNGPRRLRVDADNNVWMVAFQDSLLVKYDPAADKFTKYELPVVNELPYALNVDRERGVVWVNGNQSDNVFSFSIADERWAVYPLPRKRSFTRDIEIAEDGSVFTSNSHFPSWQIEDGQPTLIHIQPNTSKLNKPAE